MIRKLEVILSLPEAQSLSQRDLSECTCVVFDVLRATTSMTMALANGAIAIRPAAEIDEAMTFYKEAPASLLAGERHGRRILADQTGGPDFNFGNSPREFYPEKVNGKELIMTTTNGTRALRACDGAKAVYAASLMTVASTVAHLKRNLPGHLILVAAGTFEQAAYEDIIGAGALVDLLNEDYGDQADSALVALQSWKREEADLLEGLRRSKNGSRLWEIPDLKDDLPCCAQLSTQNFVMPFKDGRIHRL
ncbi:2-phosphosulfolactate phosphatase [bacterium]|nr:2-phosphosulfolactate phosphatase [bacterium]